MDGNPGLVDSLNPPAGFHHDPGPEESEEKSLSCSSQQMGRERGESLDSGQGALRVVALLRGIVQPFNRLTVSFLNTNEDFEKFLDSVETIIHERYAITGKLLSIDRSIQGLCHALKNPPPMTSSSPTPDITIDLGVVIKLFHEARFHLRKTRESVPGEEFSYLTYLNTGIKISEASVIAILKVCGHIILDPGCLNFAFKGRGVESEGINYLPTKFFCPQSPLIKYFAWREVDQMIYLYDELEQWSSHCWFKFV